MTWNCRRARAESKVWDYVLGLKPDVALLQEVAGLPSRVVEQFQVRRSRPVGSSGQPQRFESVILVRGTFGRVLHLRGSHPWARVELDRFAGNFPAFVLYPERGPEIRAINVYSPAWPVDRARLEGIDTTGVQLTQNRDVWPADLLWSALRYQTVPPEQPWVVAGDFNLSETFDAWRGGPRGNREYLGRMADLGLVECLRYQRGKLTPTFRNPRGGKIAHQIDHLFVTQCLATALVSCNAGEHDEVFGAGLSDHLPIIADFKRQGTSDGWGGGLGGA